MDLEKGIEHIEKITITSKVAQKVYISAYVYNDQHVRNGGCSEEKYRKKSEMWMYNSRLGPNWNSFKHGAFHAQAIDMAAGESMMIEMSVKFAKEDLLASDYSFVAWSDTQELQITSQGDDSPTTFPNFQLDETIQQYNWNDEAISAHHVGLLSTIGEDGEDYGDSKTNVMQVAGVLSMTLLGHCAFARHGAEKTNYYFQRV